MQLQAKELAFSYHAGRHAISTRTADCTSKLIKECFEPKFTAGATKTTKIIQKVISKTSLHLDDKLKSKKSSK